MTSGSGSFVRLSSGATSLGFLVHETFSEDFLQPFMRQRQRVNVGSFAQFADQLSFD
jgi:hypothetical protein